MSISPELKLNQLLRDFRTGMLTTITNRGQLRSRPMAVADVEADGSIWLMTQRDAPKIAEIEGQRQVNLSLQSSTKFVSLSGIAQSVIDRRKVDELWVESWKTWFPEGKDDPTLMLIHVQGETGEYWDNSGLNGIRYLIEAGRAYLSGTRPTVDDNPNVHAKVTI